MIKGIPKFITSLRRLKTKDLQSPKIFSYLPLSSSLKPNHLFGLNSLAPFSTNPHQPPSSEESTVKQETTEGQKPTSTNNKENITPKDNLDGLSIEQFVAFINDKESKHSESYKYQSKTIYALSSSLKNRNLVGKVTFDRGFWNSVYLFEVILWGPLCYLVYNYISPIGTLLPLLGFIATASATRISQSFIENSVMRMDLLNDEQVLLYPWGTQGKGVTCKIEGARVLSTKLPKGNIPKEQGEHESKESITVETEFIEDSPKGKRIKAIFLVSPTESPIENLDLFKHILTGNTSEVKKFEHCEADEERTN